MTIMTNTKANDILKVNVNYEKDYVKEIVDIHKDDELEELRG